MPRARAWSMALQGINGVPVEVEADVGGRGGEIKMVGLPDKALREAVSRVPAAVRNSGLEWPKHHVTLCLSPAALPKAGSAYDLALACASVAADKTFPTERLESTLLLGELALDGRIRRVRGVLPALIAGYRAGFRRALVPVASLREAALVDGIEVLGATTLAEAVTWLRAQPVELQGPPPSLPSDDLAVLDLADVVGQPEARWALEVAAAGSHNVLFQGPPGTGKSMLAHRLIGLLPELTMAESFEVTAIHSVAGELDDRHPLVTRPPFIAPHYNSTIAAMVGGGTGLARPGAISRAHRGVLFLDEACEFGPKCLESLRTAVEEGEVRIARRDGVTTYPARFQLIMATNICPCAPIRDVDCICTAQQRRRYYGKLSGPLLDRVDLRVRMRPQTALCTVEPPESTAVVRERVLRARKTAVHRWREFGWAANAEVPGPELRRRFALPATSTELLDRALARGVLTGRGADRCLRIAWTLADLDGGVTPTRDHVGAALEFRDRRVL
ncbi:ATP-binding protein [Pseudonocardiaceae bacterium YIM PH 21723]|nr:ATP-binding protein [Pseudonocardiaceae bacterium YIM PH 21723]